MTTTMTVSEALVRYLSQQRIDTQDGLPLFGGVFAIFGHGNVAGLGQALEEHRALPTLRAHNEQAMAHAAVAFAKTHRRRRIMACTTSIGPGATNLVTAAALAHINRLPVLFLPGDVFATRVPDPVLQQLEAPNDPTRSVNDCLRPVSRFWDRIVRPEQILSALPEAIRVLTDPVSCGPVTLALPQDVQTEALEVPDFFLERRVHRLRRTPVDAHELSEARRCLLRKKTPLIIAGGGVHYAQAHEVLSDFSKKHGVPVAETQAGKSALPFEHPHLVGAIGVTGSTAANALAEEADVIIAVGTRLSDFTTASHSLFRHPNCEVIGLNVVASDAHKQRAIPLLGDAKLGLEHLSRELENWQSSGEWQQKIQHNIQAWNQEVDSIRVNALQRPVLERPSDGEVVCVVNQCTREHSVVVAAAGGLPGELHRLWRASTPGSYHVEYGYSCMGYEIAGGLGVKLADPSREVFVLLGDGSYLMMNSEIASTVTLEKPLIIIVLDNGGFGCIHRLQKATGGAPFNNLLSGERGPKKPFIDFAQHARALGALAEEVSTLEALEPAIRRAQAADTTTVLVIKTTPHRATEAGGAWWDVAVPQVSGRKETQAARKDYEDRCRKRFNH